LNINGFQLHRMTVQIFKFLKVMTSKWC